MQADNYKNPKMENCTVISDKDNVQNQNLRQNSSPKQNKTTPIIVFTLLDLF
jgi:hypothetical protein